MNYRFQNSAIYKKIADFLVDYSTQVKKGDFVIIENFDIPNIMTSSLVEKIQKKGAHPIVWLKSWTVLNTLIKGNRLKEIDVVSAYELSLMKKANVYISIRASGGDRELDKLPKNKLAYFRRRWFKRVHYEQRMTNTRWCSVKWPTRYAAECANMSQNKFEQYFFDTCIKFNYRYLSNKMNNLVRILDNTDRIRIVGKDTDISFSKKNIKSQKSSGRFNLPDGEVFTAPVKKSLNGYITFNVPTLYNGYEFKELKFYFKNGKIINHDFKLGNLQVLETILNTDIGSRFIGEFGFGLNPLIKKPINDRMFDEKMSGSVHLAVGNSYKMADNGNRSNIHWDLILNLTKKNGGGEIYFDNQLVNKDGLFIIDELRCLNPKNVLKHED